MTSPQVPPPPLAPSGAPVRLRRADALAVETSAFAALVAGADPSAPVTACGAWRVADLVRHVVAVHRWAAAAASSGAAGLPDDAPFEAAASARGSGVEEYRDAAGELRAALVDEAAPCPTLVGRGTRAWWVRRQLHEVLVHRHDLARAVGAWPAWSTSEEVAVDAVDEVVSTMWPRQVRLGRASAPADVVRLVTPSRTWALGPVEQGPVAQGPVAQGPVGHDEPVAELAGPADVLALLLWRRLDLPAAEAAGARASGARATVDALLALPLTP
ncbi:maleylpyruvate isomerase family mycothiol-dependent enzyme [Pseudokineococcus sp. 1T1Z-3]|uniref:maleylpyruvate isomerase family mycothiol-dependent enzyme n=1 Tax=Pseudokineococcus sp. 1T1Z-3 TaxID=3132745 RepID=UPI0030961B8F